MMAAHARMARSLLRDARGSMAIETAFVVPILVMLSVGAFEASSMIARQTELQTAADEAAQIALVSPPNEAAEQTKLVEVIQASTGLTAQQVSVARKYRCSTDEGLVDDATTCDEDEPVTGYVQIDMTDSYEPIWTEIGIGSGIDYNVTRTVLVG